MATVANAALTGFIGKSATTFARARSKAACITPAASTPSVNTLLETQLQADLSHPGDGGLTE